MCSSRLAPLFQILLHFAGSHVFGSFHLGICLSLRAPGHDAACHTRAGSLVATDDRKGFDKAVGDLVVSIHN